MQQALSRDPLTEAEAAAAGGAQNSRYRNFIRENLRLDTTAVSSPIKGRAVLRRNVTLQAAPNSQLQPSSSKGKGLNLL